MRRHRAGREPFSLLDHRDHLDLNHCLWLSETADRRAGRTGYPEVAHAHVGALGAAERSKPSRTAEHSGIAQRGPRLAGSLTSRRALSRLSSPSSNARSSAATKRMSISISCSLVQVPSSRSYGARARMSNRMRRQRGLKQSPSQVLAARRLVNFVGRPLFRRDDRSRGRFRPCTLACPRCAASRRSHAREDDSDAII